MATPRVSPKQHGVSITTPQSRDERHRRSPFAAVVVFVFVFTGGVIGTSIFGQDVRGPRLTRQWTMADGLPQNTITDIAQDRDGILWLPTFGGLVRFDGHRLRPAELSIRPTPTDRLTAITIDDDGARWIGTQGAGIYRVVGNQVRHFDSDRGGSPRGAVTIIHRDETGILWAGGQGLRVWRDGRFSVPDGPEQVTNGEVRAIASADRDVWFGMPRCLFRYREGEWSEVVDPRGQSAGAHALAINAHGDLWIARGRTLTHLRRDSLEAAEVVDLGHSISHLAFDRRGRLLIGTNTAGLFFVNPTDDSDRLSASMTQLLEVDECRHVRKILRDREENIWVGTDFGLLLLREPDHRRVECNRLPVFDLRTNGTTVWARTTVTVFEIADDVASPIDRNVFLPSRELTSFAVDDDGILDVSHDNLVTTVENGRRIRRFSTSVPLLSVRSDIEGTTWATSLDALHRIDRSIEQTIPIPSRSASDQDCDLIASRRVDGNIELWMTDGGCGLIRYDGEGKFTSFPVPPDVASRQVRAIAFDDAGQAWVTTYGGGLLRFADGRYGAIRRSDGLPDDFLGGILHVDGRLWINSNRGVFVVRVNDLDELLDGGETAARFRLFSTDEGNRGEAVRTDDGRLWFPTVRGVTCIDPDDFVDMPDLSKPLVERVVKNGVTLERSDVRFTTKKRDLDFHYTVAAFHDDDRIRVRFRCRLVGYDDKWTMVGSRRLVTFTNLPPGDYRFEVSACRDNGKWGDATSWGPIVVEPLFHERPWFTPLLLGTIFAVIAVVFMNRTRAIRRRNAELSREIRYRKKAESELRHNEARLRKKRGALSSSGRKRTGGHSSPQRGRPHRRRQPRSGGTHRHRSRRSPRSAMVRTSRRRLRPRRSAETVRDTTRPRPPRRRRNRPPRRTTLALRNDDRARSR